MIIADNYRNGKYAKLFEFLEPEFNILNNFIDNFQHVSGYASYGILEKAHNFRVIRLYGQYEYDSCEEAVLYEKYEAFVVYLNVMLNYNNSEYKTDGFIHLKIPEDIGVDECGEILDKDPDTLNELFGNESFDLISKYVDEFNALVNKLLFFY